MFKFLQQFNENDVVAYHQRGALKRFQLAELIQQQVDDFGERGLQPGDRVMILLPNSLSLVVAYLACLVSGLIAVPVNNRLARREISGIAADCQPALLISDPVELHQYGFEKAGFSCPILRAGPPRTGLANRSCAAKLDKTWPGSHPAIIFYTSGSTGEPKGVLYSHRTLHEFSRMFRAQFKLGPQDSSVLSHCLSQNFVFCHLTAPFLQAGGSIRIVDFGSAAQTANALAAGATFLKLVPWFVTVLLKYYERHQVQAPALKHCLIGGDRVPLSMFSDCSRVLGVSASHNLGMTETNTYVLNPENCHGPKAGSCGLPMPGVRIEIRNPDGRVCPSGESGQIWVNTPAAMHGYWNNPAATRETLVQGWVATGDAGHLDADGYLWFDGRIKHIIICDGDNIHPVEIERAIAGHPAIRQVTVFGIPDEAHGERVAAAIVTRSGETLDLGALQEFLAPRLTQTKVPTDLLLLHSLPTTVAGKVDHTVLLKLSMSPGFGSVSPKSTVFKVGS